MEDEAGDKVSLRIAMVVEAVRAMADEHGELGDADRAAVRKVITDFLSQNAGMRLVVAGGSQGHCASPEEMGRWFADHNNGSFSEAQWAMPANAAERRVMVAAFDRVKHHDAEAERLLDALHGAYRTHMTEVRALEKARTAFGARTKLSKESLARGEAAIAKRQARILALSSAIADADQAYADHGKLRPKIR